MRQEEICRIRWSGVDVDNHMVLARDRKDPRVEQVALVTGHRDWKMLKRYTHLRPKRLHRVQRQKADVPVVLATQPLSGLSSTAVDATRLLAMELWT
jgi:hypothetical protein